MGKRQHQDQPFTPDTVDEQIEQILHQRDKWQDQTINAQAIHDLHTLYEEDADILARVRERFVANISQSDKAEAQQPLTLQRYPSGRFHSTGLQNTSLSLKSTSRRRLSLLAAGLVAAFIISSMLAVFTFARHLGTQVASLQQQQTPPGLYMGNGDMVYRIDKGNGKILWQYQLQDDRTANFGSHPPVVVVLNTGPDNTVYAVSESTIYAINATSGKLRWSNTLFKLVLNVSKPVVSGNRLYVAVNDSVYALNTTDGKVLATYNVGAKANLKQVIPVVGPDGINYEVGNDDEVTKNLIQAAVNDNMLYITWNANLYALRLPDGKQLWHKQMDQDQQFSTPHVMNGQVYVSSKSDISSKVTDYIYAFNAQTGKAVWQSNKITDGRLYDITADHGVIYGNIMTKRTFAYDAKTGEALWSTNANVVGSPKIDGSTVYSVTFNGSTSASNSKTSYISFPMGIVALNATNGHVSWMHQGNLPGEADIHITAQNGVIYVSNIENEIYALNANGRSVIWSSQLVDKSSVPAVF